MSVRLESGVATIDARVRSRWVTALWWLTALAAHLALLDAAVETLWFGSPHRWWISPALLVAAALSAWVWRPGGSAVVRFGNAPAAATPALGLLAVAAITAWLPDGRHNGMLMCLQRTSTLLSAAALFGVVAAGVACWRGAAVLAARPRLVARFLFAALTCYAVVALVIGLRDGVPFDTLFHGDAEWRQLPRLLQGTTLGGLFLVPLGLIGAVVASVRKRGSAAFARGPLAAAIALTLVFAVVLAGLSPGAAGSATGEAESARSTAAEALWAAMLGDARPPDTAAASPAERVRFLLDQFAALQRELPRETFDPGAVAAPGSTPESIFAWVRDHTYWIPYRGALRGAVGVLMDRMGSSLDRSLLLADLLSRSGQEVRLAHAELTPDQARALLARVRPVPSVRDRLPKEPAAWEARQEEVLAAYAARFSRAPDALISAVRAYRRAIPSEIAEARNQAHGQAAALMSALPAGPQSDSAAEVLAALADHWWVQYARDGSWVDLDPAPRDGVAGQAVIERPASTAERPPDDTRWFVTIKVVIERWSEGRLSEQQVLTHRMPAADAAWQDITLAHSPVGFPVASAYGRDAGEFRSAALGVREWVPVLVVAKQQVAESSFKDDGSVHERREGRSGVASGAGDLFGGLIGGADSEAASPGTLTAEWLDFEVQGPGAVPRRWRRESFDLVGPHARASMPRQAPQLDEEARARRALALLGQTAILVQVCAPSTAFLAHGMLDRFTANRDAQLNLAASGRSYKREDADLLFYRLHPPSTALWGYALGRFDGSSVGDDVFVHTPNIAALRLEIQARPGEPVSGRSVFDIVTNDVGVRPERSASAFGSRVEQGVADTVTEARVSDGGSTSEVFRQATAASLKTMLIRSKAPGAWQVSGVGPDALARIASDVAEGHHVLAPQQSVTLDGAPCLGWWRVEAATGTTVGVMDTGFHQGLSEFDIAVAGVVTGLVIVYLGAKYLDGQAREDLATLNALDSLITEAESELAGAEKKTGAGKGTGARRGGAGTGGKGGRR